MHGKSYTVRFVTSPARFCVTLYNVHRFIVFKGLVKILYYQNSTIHVSNWSTVSASLSHLLSSADSVAVLLMQSEASRASAMNPVVLPVAPRGYKCTNVSRTTSALVIGEPMVHWTLVYLTFNYLMWLVTRGTFTAVLLTLNRHKKKSISGLPRPLALFKWS